jgi:hypothetical protein
MNAETAPNALRAKIAPELASRLQGYLITLIVLLVILKLCRSNIPDSGLTALVGFATAAAVIAYLITLYSLARVLEPKASVAALVMALQLIPIIGIPVAISMIITAKRAGRTAETQKQPEPANSGDA